MQIKSPILFIEINDYDYPFAVCENNENDFDLTHFTNVPLIVFKIIKFQILTQFALL